MGKDIHSSYKYHLCFIIALGLFCIVIYSNTLNSPFVFDDFGYIKENNSIRLTHIDLEQLHNAWSKRSFGLNRPLPKISFALNYYFGKYNVRGYHIVNIAIHIINGILTYFLAVIIFKQLSAFPNPPGFLISTGQISIPLMAFFTGLFFVAHPLQTEAVTYIAQRMTSMAAMFYLLSFLLYIVGRLSQATWRRWTLWGGCLVSWIAAVWSKEIAATLPFVISLYEWYFFQDLNKQWFKRNLKYSVGFLVILGLLVFLYLGGDPIEKISGSYEYRDFTMWERVLTQFRVVVFYISLLFYPHPSRLNLFHAITTSRSLFEPISTLFSLLIIFGVIGLAIYRVREHRLISFCILWFFVNLIIESSVYGLEMIFEHRLYLPMFGFSLVVVYLLFQLLSIKRLALVINILVILSLGTATYMRNRVWKDEITFWSDVISKNPQSYRAHNNLGAAQAIQGKSAEAVKHFVEALRINPDNAEAHNNLGIALVRAGRIEESIYHFQEALRIMPRFSGARDNLKKVLEAKKKFDKAFAEIQEELGRNPNNALLYCALGDLYRKIGALDDATAQYQRALSIQPDLARALNSLAMTCSMKGQYEKAISLFMDMIGLWPEKPDTYYNIACLYARQDRIEESIDWLQKAIKMGYKDWDLIKTDKDLEMIRSTSYYEELMRGH
jgi:tetratricopeptide (TPR) repeat protein